MRVVASTLLILLVAISCSPKPPPATRPATLTEGTLHIYIRPFTDDAARLNFHLNEMSALRDDGSVVPLSLSITDMLGREQKRERRLAAGALPPGIYTGLTIGISDASLAGQGDGNSLIAPEGPVTIQAPFKIERRKAVTLSLQIDYRSSVDSGYRFTPSFSASPPVKTAPGLIGVASNRGSNEITLFDKVTGGIAGFIPAGRTPMGVTIDPVRYRAYVTSLTDDTVFSIDLLEQIVLARLTLQPGDKPRELALTPDGRTLITANSGSSTSSLIDALSLVEQDRIAVGNGPNSVLIDREGRRAWVFNSLSSNITVIDIATRTQVGTVLTDSGPLRGSFNRSGTTLFVINKSSPYLSVIDSLSLAVTNRVWVGTGITALKVDPGTDRIYIAIRGTGSIEVYDAFSLLAVDAIPTGGDVSYLTIDDQGNNLIAVIPESNEVLAIGIVSKEIAARTDLGDDPHFVALVGER